MTIANGYNDHAHNNTLDNTLLGWWRRCGCLSAGSC